MNLSQDQKHNYIEALGIDPWYPRMQLANALSAVSLGLPSDPSQSESEAELSQQAEPVRNDEFVSTEKSITATQEVKPEQATPATEQPKATLTESPIRFGIALYVIDNWIVCSSLSTDYQAHHDASVQLITSILTTLGTPSGKLNYHHVISWPFFSNPNASQGIEPAKQYVNGVIEHLVEEHQAHKLLVCGGVLAKLNQWQEIEGQDFGIHRLNIPSVYKMLIEPKQKAKAWRLIQDSALYRQQ